MASHTRIRSPFSLTRRTTRSRALHTVHIWVHWRDEEGRHMEIIFEFSLREDNGIVEARIIHKKILSHALGNKLEYIQKALPGTIESRHVYSHIGIALVPWAVSYLLVYSYRFHDIDVVALT
ncbi:hypothetical protein K504DRAFT_461762 [Pleomassaria siparia CBS 279.74]|uniref:Uncharacterized protein n=1 Tax=Pleomassaria siparia CBS 279.74 TaxID=1314801 RepID=A0A6G1KK28_9PLEO|nr:hypothetical protein K504DRAFT_461762 [Pleomassaria siparia CBS 279.74]